MGLKVGLWFDPRDVLGFSCLLETDLILQWDQMEVTAPVPADCVTQGLSPQICHHLQSGPCVDNFWRIRHPKLHYGVSLLFHFPLIPCFVFFSFSEKHYYLGMSSNRVTFPCVFSHNSHTFPLYSESSLFLTLSCFPPQPHPLETTEEPRKT